MDLFQCEIPSSPGESKTDAIGRLESLFDLALPGWRDRVTWRREQTANYRTGALDLPGQTWRDRPSIDQGDGRYLIGDCVAAPGLLAEVSINSALASRLAGSRFHTGDYSAATEVGDTKPNVSQVWQSPVFAKDGWRLIRLGDGARSNNEGADR